MNPPAIAPPLAQTVIKVCGYCRTWTGGAPLNSGRPVSHGICQPCMTKKLADLDMLKNAKNTLELMESGDAIIGSTTKSREARARLKAQIAELETRI